MEKLHRLKTSGPYITRVIDATVIFSSAWCAFFMRFHNNLVNALADQFSNYFTLVFVAAVLFVSIPSGQSRTWRAAKITSILANVSWRWSVLIAVLLVWMFVAKTSQEYSRVWLMLWATCGLILLCLVRLGECLILRYFRQRGINLRHVALVGSGQVASSLFTRISESSWSGYKIAYKILEVDDDSLSELSKAKVDEVWLALPLGQESGVKRIMHALRHSTATVRYVPDLFTLRMINHGVSDVLGVQMYDLSSSRMTGINALVKWLEDKILSLIIIILASPLMLVIAIGVKATSKGPIFYRQERVGLNNKIFNILKFRSMPIDTESSGVNWGGANSKTVTKFGKFIRRTSLDELPQFINVLKGDMSIVGPRPERPIFVDRFKNEIPDYMKKHLVKAGITGWAQVNGWRGDTDLNERIKCDLYYIENWSLMLDLKIITLTVVNGIFKSNAA